MSRLSRDLGDTATSSRAQTLPKAARVCKRAQYLSLQGEGARQPTRHFLVVHRPNQKGLARLGVTVTKKIGGAVVRNHVKRAVRECFRKTRADLPPVDLVVIARSGAGELSGSRVADELSVAFDRVAGALR